MDGAGREFCKEKRRILEREEVSDFGWRCARAVRNYAMERVFVFATGKVLAFAPGQSWFAYDRMPVCAGHGKKGRGMRGR